MGGCLVLDRLLAATPAAALRRSPRLPVLFLGHGSPMNAITDNEFRRGWQALGPEFGKAYPRPQLILCISVSARSAPASGCGGEGEKVRFFNERYQSLAMAMRSVVWG